MRIATFNVNGVNGRLRRLLEWLEETRPDIACPQETKTGDATFPVDAIRAAGYGALWHGQPRHHGVAVLARGRDPVEARQLHPDERVYTFWVNDAAFARNAGFRMDFLLLKPTLVSRLQRTEVDLAHRGRERPSDHAPVWLELAALHGQDPRQARAAASALPLPCRLRPAAVPRTPVDDRRRPRLRPARGSRPAPAGRGDTGR